MTWSLSVKGGFAAAHRLIGSGGKCESLHGHNFNVVLTVEGDSLDDTGMLLDFGILKKVLSSVLAPLDHRDLNECQAFSSQSPSSENIARHVCREASRELSGTGVRVRSVTVSESETASATYCPGKLTVGG